MKHPRDDIDPEAIPTLTRVVVPGQTRQLSLDGVDESHPETPEPPEPEISSAEIDEAVGAGLARLSAELEAHTWTEAPLEPEPILESTQESTPEPEPALAPPPPSPATTTLSSEDLQALIDDVLARHTAALREELTALLERVLGQRPPSGD